MKRTPARMAWQQLFTARRFLTETQKLSCFNMSRLAALKTHQAVSGKFLETQYNQEKFTTSHLGLPYNEQLRK